MGRREELQEKLLDIQGHTVYFPLEPGQEGEEDGGRPGIGRQSTWVDPIRPPGDRFYNKRIWHIWQEPTNFVCLEHIEGSNREHQLMFVGEGESISINRLASLGEDYGYSSRVTGIRPTDYIRINRNPDIANLSQGFSFEGFDTAVWINHNEWERVDPEDIYALGRDVPVYAAAFYVPRQCGIDLYAMARYWQQNPITVSGNSVKQMLAWFLLSSNNEWMVPGPRSRRVIVPSVDAPFVGDPKKHRHLITDLKKSLLSEKWGAE